MAWYDSAVFYHIYPLGLCGCPHDNHGEQGSHFNKITEWSDHAQRIGCTAIYIGPLFKSGSHGYDTIDYRTVDNRLGTNEDFKTYVKHCHKIGMKVIVDGVFNHTGRGFFAFEDLKRNREHSRYRDWYCNVNFWGNNEYNDGFSYDNWGGHNLLVKLNMWNQEVKNYLFDTVRFWITEFDIDGIRLDAADVLDFGFMRDLRGVCDSMKQDFWLMGPTPACSTPSPTTSSTRASSPATTTTTISRLPTRSSVFWASWGIRSAFIHLSTTTMWPASIPS